MEYKQCIVKAFEQAPDKWRASVKRSDGKPLMVVGRFKLAQFITGLDSSTAKDALLMAVAAIDAGAFFSRRATLAAASSSRHEIEAVSARPPHRSNAARPARAVHPRRRSPVRAAVKAGVARPSRNAQII